MRAVPPHKHTHYRHKYIPHIAHPWRVQAWEVIVNYVFLAPGRLEFFYTNATSRDYFL